MCDVVDRVMKSPFAYLVKEVNPVSTQSHVADSLSKQTDFFRFKCKKNWHLNCILMHIKTMLRRKVQKYNETFSFGQVTFTLTCVLIYQPDLSFIVILDLP